MFALAESIVTPCVPSITTLPSACSVIVVPTLIQLINLSLSSVVLTAYAFLAGRVQQDQLRWPSRDTIERRLIRPVPPSTRSTGPCGMVSTPLNSLAEHHRLAEIALFERRPTPRRRPPARTCQPAVLAGSGACTVRAQSLT